jgi:hypothetical protein
MKNSILTFLLGIFVAISFAATTQNLMVFRPATPKSTISYTGENPSEFTTKYAKMGYQVSSSASCGYYYTYVVMVKY